MGLEEVCVRAGEEEKEISSSSERRMGFGVSKRIAWGEWLYSLVLSAEEWVVHGFSWLVQELLWGNFLK